MTTKYDEPKKKKDFEPMGFVPQKEKCYLCDKPIGRREVRCGNCKTLNPDFNPTKFII